MRNAKQFLLCLRCGIAWGGPNSMPIKGITTEISRSGILVRCDKNDFVKIPSAGEYVAVYLELPKAPRLSRPRSLHCQATVIRTQKDADGETYIALAVDQMQFRDLPRQYLLSEDGEDTPSLLM